ncbi:MAG: DUF1697 domain-containing protein [Candidatus Saccharimonadales bacterium]
MAKYIALIRGIGPGDPRKKNDKLRGVLESLGFSGIKSVVSSGNIIFESDETDVHILEDTIEAAWPELLGFNAATIVRSQSQLQEILDADPFDGTTHSESSYLLVTFFRRPQKPNFTPPYQPPNKSYTIIGYDDDTLFSITDNSAVKTTDLMTWLEKQFTKDITSRTPLTIQRILNKMKAT